MKLKVKVRDSALRIETIRIPSERTAAELMQMLVEKQLVIPQLAHDLALKGSRERTIQNTKLSTLFEVEEKVTLENADMALTLTHRREKETLASQTLLDYEKVVQSVGKYDEMLEAVDVKNGTIFYIQQHHDQYLARREADGIEIFHFKTQYEEAFSDDRNPLVFIELKTRETLRPDELKWVRSIMFPTREKRNPLIHLNNRQVTQAHLDVIATLVHRLVVIMGKFQKCGEALEKSDVQLPTYVQLGDECSIGYIGRAQLENIHQ